jgi:hypothetical protein
MNQNNFDDICIDLKYLIINNLSFKDLVSLCCVNKEYYSLINNFICKKIFNSRLETLNKIGICIYSLNINNQLFYIQKKEGNTLNFIISDSYKKKTILSFDKLSNYLSGLININTTYNFNIYENAELDCRNFDIYESKLDSDYFPRIILVDLDEISNNLKKYFALEYNNIDLLDSLNDKDILHILYTFEEIKILYKEDDFLYIDSNTKFINTDLINNKILSISFRNILNGPIFNIYFKIDESSGLYSFYDISFEYFIYNESNEKVEDLLDIHEFFIPFEKKMLDLFSKSLNEKIKFISKSLNYYNINYNKILNISSLKTIKNKNDLINLMLDLASIIFEKKQRIGSITFSKILENNDNLTEIKFH